MTLASKPVRFLAPTQPVVWSALLAILASTVLASAGPLAESEKAPTGGPVGKVEKPAPKSSVDPASLEARFNDDGVFKLILKEERIEIATPYGKLLVPVADVQRIEFGSRIPVEDVRKIEAAIAKLGSSEFNEREAAAAELLRQQEKAYPALQAAAKNTDAEVARRAQDLLEKVRAAVPAERLVFRAQDVLYTADSKITGRIEATAFKAQTTQFGEVQMKLADLRSLSRGPAPTGRIAVVLPDPGNLSSLPIEVGQTYYIRVTGGTGGSVWGTDVYTSDSTLASVAVHAGVLPLGQTGVVKVTIVTAPPTFAGTNRNGVTSGDWGAYPIAFQVAAPEEGITIKEGPVGPPGGRFGPRGGFPGGPATIPAPELPR